MNRSPRFGLLLAVLLSILASCSAPPPAPQGPKTIVVTYSLLGSLVKDLVGDQFQVVVLMPDGLDPHEWEPSARDIATLNHADFLVRNGLGLEGGMEGALAQAQAAGVPVFTASDHLKVRRVKAGQGLPNGDADQAEGAEDPHLWLDPRGLESVVLSLAAALDARFGSALGPRAADLSQRLLALDGQIRAQVATVPEAQRLLVTGHESLGYFAEAYGFTLVGAIVPSLSSQAQVSAAAMADLKSRIGNRKVRVLFTEAGTPPKVVQALGTELGLQVVEITTHRLGAEKSYFSFLAALAQTIVEGLRAAP